MVIQTKNINAVMLNPSTAKLTWGRDITNGSHQLMYLFATGGLMQSEAMALRNEL